MRPETKHIFGGDIIERRVCQDGRWAMQLGYNKFRDGLLQGLDDLVCARSRGYYLEQRQKCKTVLSGSKR